MLPAVLEQKPRARLVIVGSEPPPRHSLPALPDNIELRGFVEDVREPLGRYAVFVCPILSGSGMRVKLLEAFAAGIPVVSTPLGAEGLAGKDGEICALADDPAEFARKIVELFDDPEKARKLACRAREQVVATRDMRVLTERLVESYREVLRAEEALNYSAGFFSVRSSFRCFTTRAGGFGELAGRRILGTLVNRPQHDPAIAIHHEEIALAAAERADSSAATAKIHVRECVLLGRLCVGSCYRRHRAMSLSPRPAWWLRRRFSALEAEDRDRPASSGMLRPRYR